MTPQADRTQDRLKDAVIEHVRKNGQKCTPLDLERKISAGFGVPGRTVRKLVKFLVLENRLAYTQQLGRTFVEISRNRPVHVGQGVILAPPDTSFSPADGQTLIRIAPGASFGLGDHATTRITLQLTSRALSNRALPCRPEKARVLDIGTGTGVLAIAACLMGAGGAVGIDTDSCARSEAVQNVCLNGLQDRILIGSGFQQDIEGKPENCPLDNSLFSLILANLRYPTLAGLHAKIRQVSTPGAVLIFSGFRKHEMKDLAGIYASCGFRRIDELTENLWCGIVLKNGVE